MTATRPGYVHLGEHDYPVEFLILCRWEPELTVLALDAAERLGYLAYCDEWTDGAKELPEVFQHAADTLLSAGRLSSKFNEFRKEPSPAGQATT